MAYKTLLVQKYAFLFIQIPTVLLQITFSIHTPFLRSLMVETNIVLPHIERPQQCLNNDTGSNLKFNYLISATEVLFFYIHHFFFLFSLRLKTLTLQELESFSCGTLHLFDALSMNQLIPHLIWFRKVFTFVQEYFIGVGTRAWSSLCSVDSGQGTRLTRG